MTSGFRFTGYGSTRYYSTQPTTSTRGEHMDTGFTLNGHHKHVKPEPEHMHQMTSKAHGPWVKFRCLNTDRDTWVLYGRTDFKCGQCQEHIRITSEQWEHIALWYIEHYPTHRIKKFLFVAVPVLVLIYYLLYGG